MTSSKEEQGKQDEKQQVLSETELAATSARILNSEELFAESEVLLISHEGKLYQLRKTANGGLILTK